MSNQSASDGIGFCGMLTILFIGLKLTDQIDWSWIWVLSPLWLGAAFVLSTAAIIVAFAFFIVAVDAILKRRP